MHRASHAYGWCNDQAAELYSGASGQLKRSTPWRTTPFPAARGGRAAHRRSV